MDKSRLLKLSRECKNRFSHFFATDVHAKFKQTVIKKHSLQSLICCVSLRGIFLSWNQDSHGRFFVSFVTNRNPPECHSLELSPGQNSTRKKQIQLVHDERPDLKGWHDFSGASASRAKNTNVQLPREKIQVSHGLCVRNTFPVFSSIFHRAQPRAITTQQPVNNSSWGESLGCSRP